MHSTSSAGRREEKLLSCTSISWSQRPWDLPWWDCSSIRQPACMGKISPQPLTSPLEIFLVTWYDLAQLIYSSHRLFLPQQLAYQVSALVAILHLDGFTTRATGPPKSACQWLSSERSTQATSAKLALKLRMPSWSDEARRPSVLVNGKLWEECQAAIGHMAGSFCTVEREFCPGAEQLPCIWTPPMRCSHRDDFGAASPPFEVLIRQE